jgi:hypothetical protein
MIQNGIAGRLTSAALTPQPTTLIERRGSGSLEFGWNWCDPRTGMAGHRVTPKKKSRSALMRSGSAMAGQKARKMSSGSKRSKNCKTRINRPSSPLPARERHVLEFNAERQADILQTRTSSSQLALPAAVLIPRRDGDPQRLLEANIQAIDRLRNGATVGISHHVPRIIHEVQVGATQHPV